MKGLHAEPGDRENQPSKNARQLRERERRFRDLVARLTELADGAYNSPQALGCVGLRNDEIPSVLAELGAIIEEARGQSGAPAASWWRAGR